MEGTCGACHCGHQCRQDGAKTAPQQPGSESAGIVQRLDDLMRSCREDGHRITYQDLLQVRNGGARG